MKTAGGDLIIGHAAHSVHDQTDSGEVVIDRVSTGTVDVTSVSGDVCVGVAPRIGSIWISRRSAAGSGVSSTPMSRAAATASPA